MNCRQVEPLLSALLEGSVAEREARLVARHLEGCAACRRRRDEFAALGSRLRGLADLAPPAHLARRAIERWSTETGASTGAPRCWRFPGSVRLASLGAAMSAAAALAALGLVLVRHAHQAPIRSPGPEMAQQQPGGPGSTVLDPGSVLSPKHATGDPNRAPRRSVNGPTLPPPAPVPFRAAFRGSATGGPDGVVGPEPENRPRRGPALPLQAGAGERIGDLDWLNGPDPVKNQQPWAPVSKDEWDRIEEQVRQHVHVRDDFVQIPFPRIAGNSGRAIVAAVEQYKQEAAIIDARLFQEVTLSFKGAALSDVCEHMRSNTGIQLSAGPSVADEKVTIFCEKLPLREVMRQLSRPFGYTWLRSGTQGQYRYELIQDLRSQLAEQELRDRDRNAAMLALEREMDRYRRYRSLSPDEAAARAKTAPPGEKELLEKLAGEGWGPIHLYFRLAPQEQAALRDGQELKFDQEPKPNELPLPADMVRPVLESGHRWRLTRRDGTLRRAAPGDVDGMPPTAVSEARALVTLSLHQSELGRFALEGASGFRIGDGEMVSLTGNGPYGVGISPSVREPDNAAVNAALARDPALRGRVNVGEAELSAADSRAAVTVSRPLSATGSPSTPKKVTSADVLEAVHRASGMPVVSDFYTRLYPSTVAQVKGERLFDGLNHLADAMRLRWHKDGAWLQFRSASFYDDRLKEVPNRLLTRWAASRRQSTGAAGTPGLPLDDLIEIAQLSDQQLDADSMAEGAKELWGLEEWELARRADQRRHLRFLAQCTPAQRQMAVSPEGLPFTRMSLAQQQQFTILAFAYDPTEPRLEDLAVASLRVRYSPPGGYECRGATEPQASRQLPAEALSMVWAPTREAALQAARRLDPQVAPEQIVPSERALTFLYTRGDSQSGLHGVAVRATMGGLSISGRGVGG
jgi:hypothetical protein